MDETHVRWVKLINLNNDTFTINDRYTVALLFEKIGFRYGNKPKKVFFGIRLITEETTNEDFQQIFECYEPTENICSIVYFE